MADQTNEEMIGALNEIEGTATESNITTTATGPAPPALDINTLLLRIEQLQTQIAALTTAQANTPTAGGDATMQPAVVNMNGVDQVISRTYHLMPKLSNFSGRREHYKGWKLKAEGKLRADGIAIGDAEA